MRERNAPYIKITGWLISFTNSRGRSAGEDHCGTVIASVFISISVGTQCQLNLDFNNSLAVHLFLLLVPYLNLSLRTLNLKSMFIVTFYVSTESAFLEIITTVVGWCTPFQHATNIYCYPYHPHANPFLFYYKYFNCPHSIGHIFDNSIHSPRKDRGCAVCTRSAAEELNIKTQTMAALIIQRAIPHIQMQGVGCMLVCFIRTSYLNARHKSQS